MYRYWQQLQVFIKLIVDCFESWTYIEAFDVGLFVNSESRPMVVSAD